MIEQPFPDTLAILPSESYVFDQPADSDRITMRVVASGRLTGGVTVSVVNLGLLGFNFAGSALGGFKRLVHHGDGLIPDAVSQNRDAMLALQANRLRLITFVTACVFGVYAERHHTSLTRMLHPTLEDIYPFAVSAEGIALFPQSDLQRLTPLLAARDRERRPPNIDLVSIEEGLALADRLMTAAASYAETDPMAMIAMAYQAMVLHGHQHAGASIALSAVVVEAAIEETMLGLGMVLGTPARLTPTQPIATAAISRRRFKDLGFGGMIQALADATVLDAYLITRIEALRTARNALMHDVQEPTPNISGTALTTMRDVLRLCTAERGFELNTGYIYRQ